MVTDGCARSRSREDLGMTNGRRYFTAAAAVVAFGCSAGGNAPERPSGSVGGASGASAAVGPGGGLPANTGGTGTGFLDVSGTGGAASGGSTSGNGGAATQPMQPQPQRVDIDH